MVNGGPSAGIIRLNGHRDCVGGAGDTHGMIVWGCDCVGSTGDTHGVIVWECDCVGGADDGCDCRVCDTLYVHINNNT